MAKCKKDEMHDEINNEQENVNESTASEEAKTKEDELAEQLAEKNEQLLRVAAEYDNFRKRTVREKECIYTDVKSNVIGDFFPVIDNFERALNNRDADVEDYKKGIDMIFGQLIEIIKKHGVEPFGEVGENFDPNLHNAVMHAEDDAFGENVIAEVFIKGYKCGDTVIRPAAVKVVN